MITAAPRPARVSMHALPMPRLAPVTRATFPSKSIRNLASFEHKRLRRAPHDELRPLVVHLGLEHEHARCRTLLHDLADDPDRVADVDRSHEGEVLPDVEGAPARQVHTDQRREVGRDEHAVDHACAEAGRPREGLVHVEWIAVAGQAGELGDLLCADRPRELSPLADGDHFEAEIPRLHSLARYMTERPEDRTRRTA